MEQTNLVAIFTTGLLTGGLTCMAVQGGLLASAIAQRAQVQFQNQLAIGHALPIIVFLTTKLIAYTVLGGVLGWLGSFFDLSLNLRIILQLLVVIFMIGTALNLLEVHPIFRYFVIQPPRFLTRFIRRQSKSGDLFAPAFLGFLTVFIPCGTTQAMMAVAILSGSALAGALVMLVFTLGTSPVFFVLGYLATQLNGVFKNYFLKITAAAILVLAVFNLNNTLALTGTRFTIGTGLHAINCAISFCSDGLQAYAKEPVSEETITIGSGGYTPDNFSVKSGEKVTLRLVNEAGGCGSAFMIPSLGIQKIVPIGKSEEITFTAPQEKGELAFMCSMGMYRGKIQVI